MSIRVLPENVASAIAAGEVVERPSSVVKELIENSLDAEANQIQVQIERAGRGLIEVGDNGTGIPAGEVELAAARYATSKVQNLDDLFAIATLGFRGEALASIAAVARMELLSCARGAEFGTRIAIEGGQVKRNERVGAAQGTNVRVRDLFFNVPARLKFLKTDRTERRKITELVTRYALAYPKVRFSLVQDGREVFYSSGSGNRREVLAEVYGLQIEQGMVAIPDHPEAPFQVEGFISAPNLHRSNRRQLTFFVNGRWVQDGSLSAAVIQAYHGLLMVGRYPIATLFITLPPETIDVNVHPAKAEIRFREREQVFSVLQRTVRATLLGHTPPPEVRLGRTWDSANWGGSEAPAIPHAVDRDPMRTVEPLETPRLPVGEIPLLRSVGQVGAAYLVAEGPDGLYLIDQHAAHERILFERLTAAAREGAVERQTLLEPLTVEFPPDQVELMEANLDVLGRLGFEVETFGRTAFRVRAVPAPLAVRDPEAVLRAAVEDFEEDETPLAEEIEARLAARVCKRASVKAGQVLSLAEQSQLLRDLEACASPRTCPHGRPTMIHLSVATLERQFGRRG